MAIPFRDWIKTRKSSTRKKPNHLAGFGTHKARFEPLEDRTLLSASVPPYVPGPVDWIELTVLPFVEEYEQSGAEVLSGGFWTNKYAEDGRVGIEVWTNPTVTAETLKSLGMEILDTSRGVAGLFPIDRLDDLRALAGPSEAYVMGYNPYYTISSPLVVLMHEFRESPDEINIDHPRLHVSGDRVGVRVLFEERIVSVTELEAIGLEISKIDLSNVFGSVPIDRLDELGALNGVLYVRADQYEAPPASAEDLALSMAGSFSPSLIQLYLDYQASPDDYVVADEALHVVDNRVAISVSSRVASASILEPGLQWLGMEIVETSADGLIVWSPIERLVDIGKLIHWPYAEPADAYDLGILDRPEEPEPSKPLPFEPISGLPVLPVIIEPAPLPANPPPPNEEPGAGTGDGGTVSLPEPGGPSPVDPIGWPELPGLIVMPGLIVWPFDPPIGIGIPLYPAEGPGSEAPPAIDAHDQYMERVGLAAWASELYADDSSQGDHDTKHMSPYALDLLAAGYWYDA